MADPKKTRAGLWLVLIVAAVIAAGGIVHSLHSTHDAGVTSPPSNDVPTVSHVTYLVDGSGGSAHLTLSTPTGQTQIDAAVPLKNKTGTAGLRFVFAPGAFLYLSAQNDGSGSVTCQILVDGVHVSENTAVGDYQIATCQGSA